MSENHTVVFLARSLITDSYEAMVRSMEVTLAVEMVAAPLYTSIKKMYLFLLRYSSYKKDVSIPTTIHLVCFTAYKK